MLPRTDPLPVMMLERNTAVPTAGQETGEDVPFGLPVMRETERESCLQYRAIDSPLDPLRLANSSLSRSLVIVV